MPTLFWMRWNKWQIPGGQQSLETGYQEGTGKLKAIIKSNSHLTFIATLKPKILKSSKKCKL